MASFPEAPAPVTDAAAAAATAPAPAADALNVVVASPSSPLKMDSSCMHLLLLLMWLLWLLLMASQSAAVNRRMD